MSGLGHLCNFWCAYCKAQTEGRALRHFWPICKIDQRLAYTSIECLACALQASDGGRGHRRGHRAAARGPGAGSCGPVPVGVGVAWQRRLSHVWHRARVQVVLPCRPQFHMGTLTANLVLHRNGPLACPGTARECRAVLVCACAVACFWIINSLAACSVVDVLNLRGQDRSTC